MDKELTLNVNGEHSFTFTPDYLSTYDVLEVKPNQYHVLKDAKAFHSKVKENHFLQKKYTVIVNGNEYNVTITDELDALIKKLGFEVGSQKKVNEILSPMPGLILDVSVKAGDTVKEGDTLMILEAMKMENVISSPRDAVIKKVDVKKGQTIEKKELLVEFE